MKDVARIMMCDQDNFKIKLVQVTEVDRQKTRRNFYGWYIIKESLETYNSYSTNLRRNIYATGALQFIKFVAVEAPYYSKYASEIKK